MTSSQCKIALVLKKQKAAYLRLFVLQ